MTTIKKEGKTYKVEEVVYGGMIINVNGTSITDINLSNKLYGYSNKETTDHSVFVDGDEIVFGSFAEAYDFAMTKQKDTFSI